MDISKLFKKLNIFHTNYKKELEEDLNQIMNSNISPTYGSFIFTNSSPPGGVGAAAQISGSAPTTFTTGQSPNWISFPSTINPLTVMSNNTKEIVRINQNGSVTWADEINIDEAAEALTKSLIISAEIKSGITKKTKTEMRDSIFDDLIQIAEQKGSLTAEDLKYLLQASKIVEKLKGGEGK